MNEYIKERERERDVLVPVNLRLTNGVGSSHGVWLGSNK
jgi:hypothetical protein